MKICSKCKKEKPDSDFYIEKSKKRKGKLMARCISCYTIHNAIYRKNNRAKVNKQHREWVKNNKDKAAFIHAKSKFGLTREQYIKFKDDWYKKSLKKMLIKVTK